MKNIFFLLLLLINVYSHSQCSAPNAINNSGCPGESGPISAQSFFGSETTAHRWYTSATGNSQVSGIVQNTAPTSGYYISTLNKSHTSTTSYYVAAVCNNTVSTTRTKVTYTVKNSSNITIGVSGGAQPQYCSGDIVSLTANGGSSYQWRKDNPNSTVLSSGTTFNASSSGTYYLTGTTVCGSIQTKSIVLTFVEAIIPALSRINVEENCGSTTITLNPPSGETWYWQTSVSGTNTSNFQLSRTFTAVTPIYIRSRIEFTNCWGPAVAVNYSVKTIPSVPNTPSITSNCGSTILTKGEAPSGVTWYWQSSASGTSTSSTSAANTITRTNGSVYYLRARNNSSGCWGTARSINYSINETPSVASLPTITENCGSTVLTKGTAPSGITWYWQSTSSGTSTSSASSANSVTRTSGSVYYLRARNNSTGCWSSTRTINYSINTIPSVPSLPTITENCGSTILTKGTAPSGVTWYWQSSASGTSTSSASASNTITRTSGSIYYLRARNNNANCWSTARTINYDVSFPTPPQAIGNSGCSGDSTPISARSISSSNIIAHIWYTTATGDTQVSDVDQNAEPASGSYISTLTKSHTATTTYYVAAVCNNVESTERTPVTYTVLSSSNIIIGVEGGARPQYCPDETVTLTANGGSNYSWRVGNPNGASQGNGLSFDVSTSGTYYLTGTNACGAQQTKSIVITIEEPDAPSFSNITVVENCGGTTITLDSPNGEVWHWQTSETGTSTLNSQSSRTFTSYEPIYIRARAEFTDCWGPAIAVNYQVRETPLPPISEDISHCGGDTFDIFASIGDDADIIKWYTTATGGTSFHEGMFYRENDTSPRTQSYFLESYNSNSDCASLTRTEVKAAIYGDNPISIPLGDQQVTFCYEQQVTLTVSLPTNADEVQWYDSNIDGTLLATGTTFTTPVISETTIYYVVGVNTTTGCQSSARLIIANYQEPRIWYADEDQDGLGDPNNATEMLCEQPLGYVANNNDTCPEIFSPTNSCSSDPLDQNYVYSRTYQTESETTIDAAFFTKNDNLIQDITYFDGLGRQIQQAGIQQSPSRQDIVTHTEYDGFGRTEKEWLPYPTTDGATAIYRLSPRSGILNFYNQPTFQNTQNPYSQTQFENSPLNRVKLQAAPGEDWALSNGHEIGFEYVNNTTADEVLLFDVTTTFSDHTYTPTLVENGLYDEGELFKTITYDENYSGTGNNHSTEEFINKSGQVVLKRSYNEEEAHDTYYVYDDFGNLSYVLPPKVITSDGVSEIELNELSYQYKYDHRNRLIEKKIPGKGLEYIVYNKLDQPILTQDANQGTKSPKEWLFTKYDAFGRVVYTGIKKANISRSIFQEVVNDPTNTIQFERRTDTPQTIAGTTIYYTINSNPIVVDEILTVNYYDDYEVGDIVAFNPANGSGTWEGMTVTANVQGLPTVSQVRVLDTDQWITSATYYDEKGRAWETHVKNDYLKTEDWVLNQLDFVGRILKTRSSHTKDNSEPIVTIDNFTYDHVGRLLTQKQQINNQAEEIIVDNVYDEIGRLVQKKVGGSLYKDVVGVEMGTDNTITKTSSGGWGTAGLASTQKIYTAGYVDYEVVQTDKVIMVGLSEENIDAHYNTIDYALYTYHQNNRLLVFEKGVNKGDVGTYEVGDILKIEKQGTSIVYIKNEEVVYASQTPSTTPVLLDVAIGNIGAAIKNLTMYGGSLEKALQTVDYAYNVRGWLTAINNDENNDNDLFNFGIAYNDIDDVSKKLYNGNISQTTWDTASNNASNNPVSNQYTYTYDALNRINNAIDNTGNYNLSNVVYDKNGNILSLIRNGHTNDTATSFGEMDELSYHYDNGNKLLAVTDSSGSLEGFKDGNTSNEDFRYDVNGNLIIDYNKNISGIKYNHLNLPTQVNFNGGTEYIKYIYDATGVKLKKIVTTPEDRIITDYAGNYIYKDFKLQFFNHSEGYVEPEGNIFNFVYQYKDHLGNIRLSYSDSDNDGSIDPATEIISDKNYYPFGLQHKGYNNVITSTNPAQNYMYNQGTSGTNFQGEEGKSFKVERQKELGLNLDMTKFRMYDYTLGRFTSIDPLADANPQESWTPYQYAYNSPIQYNDPYGDCPECWDFISSYASGAWEAGGNIVKGVVTGTVTGISNGINAAGQVADAYQEGGASAAASEYVNQVYETSGAKSAVETATAAANGDANAIGKTVVNVVAIAMTRQVAKSKPSSATATTAEAPVTNTIYKRPNNATTPAQRASVQNKPCVDCGATGQKNFADHKKVLVEEHYETGTIDKTNMRSLEAVQPQCQSCQSAQATQARAYSMRMRAIIKERTKE